jgi:hypothetical protein
MLNVSSKKRQELISRVMIFSTSPSESPGQPGVIFVSKRLPITSGARKVASMNSHVEGTGHRSQTKRKHRSSIEQRLKLEYNATPVFIDSKPADRHYWLFKP